MKSLIICVQQMQSTGYMSACANIGEAAGVAAAIAHENGCSVKAVSIVELRERIVSLGLANGRYKDFYRRFCKTGKMASIHQDFERIV